MDEIIGLHCVSVTVQLIAWKHLNDENGYWSTFEVAVKIVELLEKV